MQLVKKKITLKQLNQMAEATFGSLVKAVVDINQQIMVVDAELHADQEQKLLQQGSNQVDLWGINLYPAKFNTSEFIEFDSMINLKPNQNNLSRSVEDKKIRAKIKVIVDKLVSK